MTSSYAIFAAAKWFAMRRRFFGAPAGDRPSTVDERRMPLLDNPVAVVENHPDVAREAAERAARPHGSLDMAGMLSKRSSGRRLLPGDDWKPRFFVLRDQELVYYASEADYREHRAPARSDEPIRLGALPAREPTARSGPRSASVAAQAATKCSWTWLILAGASRFGPSGTDAALGISAHPRSSYA